MDELYPVELGGLITLVSLVEVRYTGLEVIVIDCETGVELGLTLEETGIEEGGGRKDDIYPAVERSLAEDVGRGNLSVALESDDELGEVLDDKEDIDGLGLIDRVGEGSKTGVLGRVEELGGIAEKTLDLADGLEK